MNSESFKKQIGSKVRKLRQIRGWSREQVASKLEMSGNGIGHIERGEVDISLTRLSEIAEVFDVELDDLLGLNERNIFNFKNRIAAQ